MNTARGAFAPDRPGEDLEQLPNCSVADATRDGEVAARIDEVAYICYLLRLTAGSDLLDRCALLVEEKS